MIASASEDNTVRLWQPDGNCLQVIEHPGCVWDVAFLPGGDLVTACSDYAARVWTRDSSRVADEDIIKARGRSLLLMPTGRTVALTLAAEHAAVYAQA